MAFDRPLIALEIDITSRISGIHSGCQGGCEGSVGKTESENKELTGGRASRRPRAKEKKAAQKAVVGRRNLSVGSA